MPNRKSSKKYEHTISGGARTPRSRQASHISHTGAQSVDLKTALRKIERYKPIGYKYIIDNIDEIESWYEENQRVRPPNDVEFFSLKYKQRKARSGLKKPHRHKLHVDKQRIRYVDLALIARKSEANGFLVRPCCSTYPGTWPLCNAAC